MVGEREDLSQAVNSAAADQESGHIELINKVRGGLLLFCTFLQPDSNLFRLRSAADTVCIGTVVLSCKKQTGSVAEQPHFGSVWDPGFFLPDPDQTFLPSPDLDRPKIRIRSGKNPDP